MSIDAGTANQSKERLSRDLCSMFLTSSTVECQRGCHDSEFVVLKVPLG